jgi:hypothetical protein
MTTTTNTTTAPLSTVIGVFPDHEQADRAIDELRHVNFSYERIRVVERGTGGFGDTLKGLFTGQSATTSNTADSLVKMGMPEYEAQYYQQELDSQHVLVLMNADDRPEAAFSIMRQNGAFDINSRLRMTPTDDPMETPDANGLRAASYQNTPPMAPARDVLVNAANPGARYPEGSQAAYDPTTPRGSQATYNPANSPVDPNVSPVSSDPDAFAEHTDREAPRNA